MSKGIIIAVVVLLIVGAGAFLLTQNQTSQPTETVAEEEQPTEQVTTESQPTITEEIQDESQTSEVVTVTLGSNFSPASVTIKKGTKVVWMNNSGAQATVHSNPHPVHTSYPEMNLGAFADGETIELVFNEPGTYNYHNHFQSSQGGTVIVEE